MGWWENVAIARSLHAWRNNFCKARIDYLLTYGYACTEIGIYSNTRNVINCSSNPGGWEVVHTVGICSGSDRGDKHQAGLRPDTIYRQLPVVFRRILHGRLSTSWRLYMRRALVRWASAYPTRCISLINSMTCCIICGGRFLCCSNDYLSACVSRSINESIFNSLSLPVLHSGLQRDPLAAHLDD